MPPNSKGGAFVRDPKISREPEVTASVKLRFVDVSGLSLPLHCGELPGNVSIVKRTQQSTQKASKLETKTLESVIQTLDAQGRVCVSFFCF
jgi:DNA repair protein RAD50